MNVLKFAVGYYVVAMHDIIENACGDHPDILLAKTGDVMMIYGIGNFSFHWLVQKGKEKFYVYEKDVRSLSEETFTTQGMSREQLLYQRSNLIRKLNQDMTNQSRLLLAIAIMHENGGSFPESNLLTAEDMATVLSYRNREKEETGDAI